MLGHCPAMKSSPEILSMASNNCCYIDFNLAKTVIIYLFNVKIVLKYKIDRVRNIAQNTDKTQNTLA